PMLSTPVISNPIVISPYGSYLLYPTPILLPTSSTETIPQQYQVPSSFFGQTNNNQMMEVDDYYEPNGINSNGTV
ncbi:9494_t:CDS:1, partial [Paraglomus brasilianum]